MSRDNTTTTAEGSDERRLRTDGGTVEEDEGLFPVGGKWFQVGFYLFLLSWLGFMLFEAYGYTREQDYLFPLVVGVPVMLLLLLKMLIVLYPKVATRLLPSEAEGDSMFEGVEGVGTRNSKAEKEKYELIMIGWIIILPFMMYFAGMGWTLIVYTFAFTWYFTRSVRQAAMVTVVVIIFVWVLFIEILSLIVWDGTLGLPAPLETLADLRG